MTTSEEKAVDSQPPLARSNGPTLRAQSRRSPCECGVLELPSLLEALHYPAALLSKNYQILAANASFRDSYSSGAKVCGRLCFEVAHGLAEPCSKEGISCPLRQAARTGERASMLHTHQGGGAVRQDQVSIYPLHGESEEIGTFLEILRPARWGTADHRPAGLIGKSETFNHMLELVARVAPAQTTVLLLGETGTGKELVAGTIHRLSSRSSGPFVPVDCSGLTETLVESELFGHEKGAFTGATHAKRGLVEAADGGTLFLDEVGDIPLALQVKLLRLLESGVFRRVGSVRAIHSDFRLVCATHQDLYRMTEDGSFRTDLYYRISSFPISLPPLRERPGDILLLVRGLLDRLGCSRLTRIDPEVISALEAYEFPGNVRELQNILERSCLLSEGDTLLPEHLPRACRSASGNEAVLPRDTLVPLHEMESRYLKWALSHFEGERSELAQRLGISERTLYRRLHDVRGEDEEEDL